ncbi:response regulator transcription factor [Metabacillus idriensis]|uniref:response regulator transcription factor n=1 Tax=Metabacillus idriensis TaxID=324768 RepID=UPI0008A9838E|nr:response regulator transcription factor [Metabacillus idriensis]MCM3597923.1 response regulator transcription factor [Metabacillus idriensis]OHR73600.1 hypothetical protein HMPREF3291_18835 [Bacillus sp. HMSC76G11]
MTSILLIGEKDRGENNLSAIFISQGFNCLYTTYEEAVALLHEKALDLILFDIENQSINGAETCHEIRCKTSVPILVLTTSDNKRDILNLYSAGADDLIRKPIDREILLAKINAVLRRFERVPTLVFKGLSLDEKLFEVKYLGELLPTTKKEYALIENFLQYPNQVFSREDLIRLFWDHKYTDCRTVDSHIRNIRGKLRSVNFPVEDHLKTVWGYGYNWIE